jgi:hypothetical protein
MSKPKRTITRDSVFRDVGAAEVRGDQELPKQGIPQDETRSRQTAVWLGDDEVEWLDSQCRTVQRGGWRGVTRSALIRALIKAASEQQINLAGVSGEVEIAERLISTKE